MLFQKLKALVKVNSSVLGYFGKEVFGTQVMTVKDRICGRFARILEFVLVISKNSTVLAVITVKVLFKIFGIVFALYYRIVYIYALYAQPADKIVVYRIKRRIFGVYGFSGSSAISSAVGSWFPSCNMLL